MLFASQAVFCCSNRGFDYALAEIKDLRPSVEQGVQVYHFGDEQKSHNILLE